MPNATVRANARTMPKPATDSPESIRRQVADIETARTLLKAVKVVEREPTDPVFALIDRHRAATAVWLEALRWADNDLATEADEAADTAACEVETEAMAALLETIPQTVEGVAAVLRYIATVDGGCAPDDVQKFAAYVARSPVFKGRAA